MPMPARQRAGRAVYGAARFAALCTRLSHWARDLRSARGHVTYVLHAAIAPDA